jgi:hypothetical protein
MKTSKLIATGCGGNSPSPPALAGGEGRNKHCCENNASNRVRWAIGAGLGGYKK